MNSTNTASLSNVLNAPKLKEGEVKDSHVQAKDSSSDTDFKDNMQAIEKKRANRPDTNKPDKPELAQERPVEDKSDVTKIEETDKTAVETDINAEVALEESTETALVNIIGSQESEIGGVITPTQLTTITAPVNDGEINTELTALEPAPLLTTDLLSTTAATLATTTAETTLRAQAAQQGVSPLSSSILGLSQLNQMIPQAKPEGLLPPVVLSDLPAFSGSLLTQTKTSDTKLVLTHAPSITEDNGLAASTLTSRPAAPSSEPQLPSTLNTSYQQAKWGEAVTEKVMWMSSKGIKEATIQLDPPELGHLTIKVGVNQDQAHVSFTVQNASVREALDQNSLRLREMFAQEGLDLADVDVSDQSQSNADEQPESVFSSEQENSNYDTAEDIDVSTQSIRVNYSIIDSYA